MKTAIDQYDSYARDSSVDVSGYYRACVQLMDDQLREQVHSELAPCTEREFLERYSELHLAKFNEEFVCN